MREEERQKDLHRKQQQQQQQQQQLLLQQEKEQKANNMNNNVKNVGDMGSLVMEGVEGEEMKMAVQLSLQETNTTRPPFNQPQQPNYGNNNISAGEEEDELMRQAIALSLQNNN